MVREEINIKKYLLGATDEAEQLAIEERLLLDDEYFNQLLIAEDELTDAYVDESLSAEERERFENHFLSTTERRQKLRFASALRRRLEPLAVRTQSAEPVLPVKLAWHRRLSDFLQTPYPGPRVVLAAGMGLLILSISWLAFNVIRLQNEATQLRAQISAPPAAEQELQKLLLEANARREQLERTLQEREAQIAQLEARAPKTQIVTPPPAFSTVIPSFTLIPGTVLRGDSDRANVSSPNRVDIPAAARGLKLQLELEKDQYSDYQATLQTQGGSFIKRWERLAPQETKDGKSLLLQFPSSLLSSGSYSLRLEGVVDGRSEKADQFHFHVTRR